MLYTLCWEWCAYVCFDRTFRSRRSISTCINYFTSQQRAEIPIPKRVTWTWNCFSSPSPPRSLPSWFIVVNILVSLLCAQCHGKISSSLRRHLSCDRSSSMTEISLYFDLIRHQIERPKQVSKRFSSHIRRCFDSRSAKVTTKKLNLLDREMKTEK